MGKLDDQLAALATMSPAQLRGAWLQTFKTPAPPIGHRLLGMALAHRLQEKRLGGLTLNVLLSFAQFEREVISERVRDKIAASKRKGMWMGGNVPLGYDVKERKLVVNDVEADRVRHIFRRYLGLGYVSATLLDLAQNDIRTKLHVDEDGGTRGGKLFTHGALYHILSNRIYLGDIVHKGVIHLGEHEAIVPQELWDQVHAQLAANRIQRHHQTNAVDPSILAGMIRDGEGRRMTPSHARRGSTKYRYYVSVDEQPKQAPKPIRIAANPIEQAIAASLALLLQNRASLRSVFQTQATSASAAERLFATADGLARGLPGMSPSDKRALLITCRLHVIVHADRIEAWIDPMGLAEQLSLAVMEDLDPVSLDIPTITISRGKDIRLTIAPEAQLTPPRRDPKLVELVVEAFAARRRLGLDGDVIGDLDQLDYGGRNKLARVARMSFLAPDIITAIFQGRQPPGLFARRLLRACEFPVDWNEQRRMFGFS